ncbi:MAG: hypothetical protein IPL59_15930 [Candidatus Competibacteraceae bacterium]|nr:hypothetical protein [Candidatus Competibacteraceae bacterium]
MFESGPSPCWFMPPKIYSTPLRSQTVTFERGMVDLLLDALDQVSQWLDLLEQTETLPVELERPPVNWVRSCEYS